MKDPGTKVISFPSPVPSKADYQRVKSSYSIKEIKQLFGLSEKTIRRWTEQGIIHAASVSPDLVYDFQALTQFRRVRELRAQGQSLRQVEAEPGQRHHADDHALQLHLIRLDKDWLHCRIGGLQTNAALFAQIGNQVPHVARARRVEATHANDAGAENNNVRNFHGSGML